MHGVVVIADTDRTFSASMAASLRNSGCDVELVPCISRLEATTHAQRDDMTIVMELCPDGVPRLDVLRSTRSRLPEARIVVLTAYPSLRGAVAALQGGANDYLAKPISASELLLTLRGICQRAPEPANLPSLDWIEWEYINRVLTHTAGNISAAARVLRIQRSTLQRKLRKYPPRV
jgi:two-component system response regulator RegA